MQRKGLGVFGVEESFVLFSVSSWLTDCNPFSEPLKKVAILYLATYFRWLPVSADTTRLLCDWEREEQCRNLESCRIHW